MSTTYAVGTGTATGAAGTSSLDLSLTATAESQAVVREFTLNNAYAPFFLEVRTLNASVAGSYNELTNAAGTIPAKAAGVVIVPPSTGPTGIYLKGDTGDVGIVLHTTAPFVLVFPTSHAGLIVGLAVTAATTTTYNFTFAWF